MTHTPIQNQHQNLPNPRLTWEQSSQVMVRRFLTFYQLAPLRGPRAKLVKSSVFSSYSLYLLSLPASVHLSPPPSAVPPRLAPSLPSRLEMGNSSRQKTGPQTNSHGANTIQNNTSSQNTQDFSPRANLKAQITASPSPVTSAKDARSWLESKGWILNSEDNSDSKLSDILLSATIS